MQLAGENRAETNCPCRELTASTTHGMAKLPHDKWKIPKVESPKYGSDELITFKDKVNKIWSNTQNCVVLRQEAGAGNEGSSPHTGTDHMSLGAESRGAFLALAEPLDSKPTNYTVRPHKGSPTHGTLHSECGAISPLEIYSKCF